MPVGHLRSFRNVLFQSIKESDLKRDGEYFQSAVDVAVMYPALEMAHLHVLHLPEITYWYNVQTENNIFRDPVRAEKQFQTGQYIRRSMPRYSPIEDPTLLYQ